MRLFTVPSRVSMAERGVNSIVVRVPSIPVSSLS